MLDAIRQNVDLIRQSRGAAREPFRLRCHQRFDRHGAMPTIGVTAPRLEELGNIACAGNYDNAVTLSAGSYEGEPLVPDGAARPRVDLLSDLTTTNDFDGDGWDDAYVLLNESSGGTGSKLYTRRAWFFRKARCLDRAREQGATMSNSKPYFASCLAEACCEIFQDRLAL
jgi:hypothetical protein